MFDLDEALTTLPEGARFGMLMFQPEGTRNHPSPHWVCSLLNLRSERGVVPLLAYGRGANPALAIASAIAEWNHSEKKYLEAPAPRPTSPKQPLTKLSIEDLF